MLDVGLDLAKIFIVGQTILSQHTVMTLHTSIARRIVFCMRVGAMLLLMMMLMLRSLS